MILLTTVMSLGLKSVSNGVVVSAQERRKTFHILYQEKKLVGNIMGI